MLTGPLFKYLSGGLALALLIFIGLWKMEQRHARKADEQIVKISKLLKDADKKSRETTKAQEKVITRYITVEKPKAEGKAKEVETAPLPGNCGTPKAIMEADL